MEAIINYKLCDFLQLKDYNTVNEYVDILSILRPIDSISNPRYIKWKFWDKKTSKSILLNDIKQMSFADVTNIRTAFNDGVADGIIESVELVTGLTKKEILNFTITMFYGIINHIKDVLIEISTMEINELSDDGFDFNLEELNANQRMERYGVFNTIDSLAKGDVLRWSEIEKLPYLVVFTKLRMDKEKNNIQKELNELINKKNK